MKIKYLFILGIIFLGACKSEQKKKDILVSYMARDMCKEINTDISRGIEQMGTGDAALAAIASTIINALDVPIEDFCHCFTDIMSQELVNRFTYKELLELRKDKIKQLMVANKIIEQRDIEADIENCLTESFQKTSKEYEDFQKKLDEKFK